MPIDFIPQHDKMDCGPACLAMVASYYGKHYGLQYLRENSFLSREGVSLLSMGEAAGEIGFDAIAARLNTEMLIGGEVPLPVILHWNQNHFVVLHKISKHPFTRKYRFSIADPAHGIISLPQEKFEKHWLDSGDPEGIGLLTYPTDKFFAAEPPKETNVPLRYLFGYLTPYKKSLGWVLFLLFINSLILLIFPFITENLIDKGVNARNLHFITMMLLAQLSLFLGGLAMDMSRGWIMLMVGTKVNIRIISEFLKKLLRLPIRFFDTKLSGDFNQRINDHDRIENFLTSQSLLTFFSMLTFSVFFGVLWYYNVLIVLVYFSLTALAVTWSLFWMKRRKILDYFKFQQRSENQESIYEMINGVSEMKLNQFEDYKRGQWEEIQQKLFKINIRILRLDQIQVSGYDFINQLKNILVTFLAASLVVGDKMTLGALLSISYIIGQMNSPVNQLMGFFKSLQDARLSLARLNEVQAHPEEDAWLKERPLPALPSAAEIGKLHFNIKSLNFQYEGPKSPLVLEDLNMLIPHGKITAIVGASGSGKTTLMKLLLKFYEPISGNIQLGDYNLADLPNLWLRQNSGVVMQDGFIFGDTIERNIVCGEEDIDYDKLNNALKTANIQDFIASLPLGLHTKIGASGNGISGGQRQRILIARAVYKNPQFLFFDEATSALDADNEKIIHNNLNAFFKGKTVIIIAHRLSTVKNADQIIVLKNGKIVERGMHQALVTNKADYYNLVKNQLELGN